MRRICREWYFAVFLVLLVFIGCSQQKRLAVIKRGEVNAKVVLPSNTVGYDNFNSMKSDSLGSAGDAVSGEIEDRVKTVQNDEVFYMNTVNDDPDGETVITGRIKEVVVEAPFKNIAERDGFVKLSFDIIIPSEMMNSNWQIRLFPTIYFLSDSLKLNKFYITGKNYREKQMRGYDLYNRFLNTIIDNPYNDNDFYYMRLLEIFIKRNYADLYRLKSDTLFREVGYIENSFGDEVKEAISHYAKSWMFARNNRRKGKIGKKYEKYIKVPIDTMNIKLDTVINNSNNTLTYRYIYNMKAMPDLKRVELLINGTINDYSKELYRIPTMPKLTFYISSISWFVSDEQRFIKQIVERNAYFSTSAYIDFLSGKYSIIDTLSNNLTEIGRIKQSIREFASNKDYVLDSIGITSSCSPEGKLKDNVVLAKRRGESVKNYLFGYFSFLTDSLKNSSIVVNADDSYDIESANTDDSEIHDIERVKFNVTSISENWDKLYKLIGSDDNVINKQQLWDLFEIEDLDLRESRMSRMKDYKYIRSVLYPYLRNVKFDFYLHRRGMIKDTVHTTVVDTLYMNGIKALQDKDYRLAINCLKDYKDYNSAVAYLSLSYNNSALSILNELKETAKVLYLKAIVNIRLHNEHVAVDLLKRAIQADPSLRFRVNLDPEASWLLSKYKSELQPVIDDY